MRTFRFIEAQCFTERWEAYALVGHARCAQQLSAVQTSARRFSAWTGRVAPH